MKTKIYAPSPLTLSLRSFTHSAQNSVQFNIAEIWTFDQTTFKVYRCYVSVRLSAVTRAVYCCLGSAVNGISVLGRKDVTYYL